VKKTRNRVKKTRNRVGKTRNRVKKTRNRAGKTRYARLYGGTICAFATCDAAGAPYFSGEITRRVGQLGAKGAHSTLDNPDTIALRDLSEEELRLANGRLRVPIPFAPVAGLRFAGINPSLSMQRPPSSSPASPSLLSGEAGEFSALLAEVLPSALKTATFLTRNPDDAEDLVQDAAIQAFRAFGNFERGTNFKAWFLKVQYRCFLGRLRSAARQPQTVALENEEGDEMPFFPASMRDDGRFVGGDPAQELWNRLDAAQIADALRALPDEFRDVATLYFVNQMSYEQIARVVERPLNTVRSRLHRGRKLLQGSLWELARERGLVRGEKEGGG